ncbi:MAG: pectic acid lyase [Verrucomicrobia bacterium]|jgi:PelA/Pel-15E family pectate lyase|nr:pectic acid lyase [Verrucomicrobiota bacterium]
MKTFATLLVVAASLMAAPSHAAPSAPEVKAAMTKATKYMQSIATEGGYLWLYSDDLKFRAGEVTATATQIWIQPPGTPKMGEAFLRAYSVSGDAIHLDAARNAALALAKGQLESGGWDYSIDFDPAKFPLAYRRTDAGKLSAAEAAKRKNTSTYDDNNTQDALRFMMEYVAVVTTSTKPEDKEIRTALDYGLKKMLEAQYPIGAWPQRYDGKPKSATEYPVKKASIPKTYPREYQKVDYKGHYTLNDGTLADCVDIMLIAHKQFGDAKYLAAAKRAGDFLLLAQLPEPQPAWAQQYNQNMEPAWARAFEPPSVTGGESGGAIRTLIRLHLETGDAKYIEPIPRALAWYKRSEIAPNKWARYYELTTNKPIYGDRDGKIYYRLQDISKERQTGYGWEGDFNMRRTFLQWDELQKDGREKTAAKRTPKPMSDKNRAEAQTKLAPAAEKAIKELDAQGRWITSGKPVKEAKDLKSGQRIETDVFMENLRTLSNYLEALEGKR